MFLCDITLVVSDMTFFRISAKQLHDNSLAVPRAQVFNMAVDNDEFEYLLNIVDDRTVIQRQLHDALSNGFMCLARERYRDALALYRKFIIFCPKPFYDRSVYLLLVNWTTDD